MQSKLATTEQQAELEALREEWSLSRILQLPPYPTIVLAGAYKGKLMQYFLEYVPDSYVAGYEPQDWAYNEAAARLKPYFPISWLLSPLALGTSNKSDIPMGEWGTDACSFLTSEREQGIAPLMVDAAAELSQMYDIVDLLVLNMEGYEFELLPHLLSSFNMQHIKSLAVQFHLQYSTPSKYMHLLHQLDAMYPNRFMYNLPAWGYWWS